MIGCGGVGLQVVTGARLAGAGRIVAVDRDPSKLALARARGATDVVEAGRRGARGTSRSWCPTASTMRSRAIGRGDTIRLAWDVLRPRGPGDRGRDRAGRRRGLAARVDLLNEKVLRGCFYGSADVAEELPGLIALAASGEIDLVSVVSHFTDLDGVEEALQRLRRGEGARTVVIVDPELAGRGVESSVGSPP